MFRPIELYIGLRYTRASRGNHFISFISLISIAGVGLGVMALITVLSVMNGFENELRSRILGMASHATISTFDSRLQDWQSVVEQVSKHPEVLGTAPYVEGQVMLNRGKQVSGTLIRGILPAREGQVADISEHMVTGSLDALKPRGYGIILGSELARALGAQTGDKVTVITPQTIVTPAGIVPRIKRFTVVGVFEIGMYEYDRNLAIMQLDDASRLFALDGGVSGVRLKLDDLFEAPLVVRQLALDLPATYYLSDWTRQHANFFRAVRTEKRVMFIILVLIVAVAAFNIVSTLVMVVTEKRSDIAILRTLGLSPAAIMRVFVVQGVLIGMLGTLIGLAGGISLALNVETIVPAIERAFEVDFLAADVYYISDLPSDLHWNDVVQVGVVAFALSILATLYPAWRAARTQPAEALRYE